MTEGKVRIQTAQEGHFVQMWKGGGQFTPPYQLRQMEMIYIVGHWPEGAPLPPLPEGLSPSASRTGVIGLYASNDARGLAPCRLLFGGITVRETYAPDGTEAAYLFHGLLDGPAADVLPRFINANYVPATVTLTRSPQGLRGEAILPDGAGRWVIDLDPDPATEMIDSGTNYYIGMLNGHPHGFAVTYSITSQFSRLREFTLDLPPDHPFAVFRHMTVDLTMTIRDMSMTYGVPAALDLATPTRDSTMARLHERDAALTGALDIFARIGRSLAIIDDTGRVLYANAGAERLLARLRAPQDRLGPPRLVPPAGPSWTARPLSAEGVRLALVLDDGGTAFARVMPISLKLSDRPAMMVLLDDPAEVGPHDPAALLRLYGLTGAEARLAVLVGQGQPPAQAARAQGITVETARTMLKQIYAKLAINRQAELARIVARLEMV